MEKTESFTEKNQARLGIKRFHLSRCIREKGIKKKKTAFELPFIELRRNRFVNVSADDGKLYLWGKNASQVIRDDESSRFFQFEPYHVSMGTWKALKVSLLCIILVTVFRHI